MGSYRELCTTSAAELRVTGGRVPTSVASVRSGPEQGYTLIRDKDLGLGFGFGLIRYADWVNGNGYKFGIVIGFRACLI